MIDTREIATAKIVMLGGGGGGTSNYNQLNNKPSINGVTLQGNKTSADLNISGMPENPLATSHGGTGNADGYIRKGVAQRSTVGNGATAEGYGNTVSGDYSHAEGSGNTASSYHTHAEGSANTASAPQAHAEGYGTTASGAHSHAGGAHTVAGYANQTAIGEYNDNKATTLLEVGNGTADNARSNAFEVHSNGDIVAGGTVSDENGTLNAVVGNPSDTASSIIDKVKIGSRTYDTSAIKPYTATNITTSAITIAIGLAEASALNGRIIAVNTGSRSGAPSNAWGLNILYNGGGSSVGCAILKSDGTAFTDAVTANEVLFLSMNMTNLEATIVNIAGASGGGGSSDPYDGRKIRYTISSSNWSSSPNSDGYYTYSLTLTNPLTTNTSPNVYIAGSTDSTQPTATEQTMFSYVKQCNLSSSTTLVLYATTKPTSTFYVFVGAEGGTNITYSDLTVTKSDFTQITDGYRCLSQMTNAQKKAWLASNKATFVFVYNGTVSYYAIGNLTSPIITTKAMTQVSGLQKYSAFGLHSSMKSFDLLIEPNQTAFDIVLTTSGYSSLPNEPFKVLMAFES